MHPSAKSCWRIAAKWSTYQRCHAAFIAKGRMHGTNPHADTQDHNLFAPYQVALLFLVKKDLPHLATWELWLRSAEGLLPSNQVVNVDALFLQQGAPGGRRSLLRAVPGAGRADNGTSGGPMMAPAAGPQGGTPPGSGDAGAPGPTLVVVTDAEGPGLVISDEVINDYRIPDEDAAADAVHHDPVWVVARDVISSCMVR